MTTRRDFLKRSALLGSAAAVIPFFRPVPVEAGLREDAERRFTLWQIPLLQNHSQGNSYVFRTSGGKVVVMDGGVGPEAGYLRGFLGVLGNEVEAWFISHPHRDHIEACNEILKKPDELKIKSLYHSEFSPEFYDKVEPNSRNLTAEFYANLKKSDIAVTDVTEPGLEVEIDGVSFKILDVKDESVTTNAYNNSCMVVRVDDGVRSAVFLGDAGVEQGDRLLKGPFRKDLDCRYLQMAHHGQYGVSLDFYRTVEFDACLWPTPKWLYDNDAGQGYDTHTWQTIIVRNLMDEIGIKKHFIGWQGLCVVD